MHVCAFLLLWKYVDTESCFYAILLRYFLNTLQN
nr:MAG TPA: hypothetical protein [Caudoviricetes sp.]